MTTSILDPGRFAALTRGQRMLMIANEMNRASKWMAVDQLELRRSAYRQVLLLADLCSDVERGRGVLKELRRFRECIAGLWLDDAPRAEEHGELFYALLTFTPETLAQMPYVTGLPQRVTARLHNGRAGSAD